MVKNLVKFKKLKFFIKIAKSIKKIRAIDFLIFKAKIVFI